MKRYIYIIIGIIVAAAVAILVLLWIKSRSAGPSVTGSNATTTGSLPTVGTQGSNGGGVSNPVSTLGLAPIASGTPAASASGGAMTVQNFGVLSQSPVLDYFVNAQNNITAIEPTGEVISVSNGQTTVVDSSTVSDIIAASFSYDGKKILVNYGDPSNPQSGIFDVTTNAWTPLPQGILSPQWSPTDNYQIAYLATTNNGKLALATINAASPKTAPTTLLALSADDLTLQWPQSDEFVLSDKPTTESDGSIWAFNPQTGAFNSVLYNVSGAESTWSNSAAFPYGLLFSNAGSGSDQLQLQSLSGGFSAKLTILTLPSKCAFNQELAPIATSTVAGASSSTTATSSVASSTKKSSPAKAANAPTSTPYLALYCGLPRSSSFSSANLPDAYNMMALFTSDDIYKINTATGAIQSLWSDPTQNVDISDMKLFNGALFFVNRYDQKLYGLTFN